MRGRSPQEQEKCRESNEKKSDSRGLRRGNRGPGNCVDLARFLIIGCAEAIIDFGQDYRDVSDVAIQIEIVVYGPHAEREASDRSAGECDRCGVCENARTIGRERTLACSTPKSIKTEILCAVQSRAANDYRRACVGTRSNGRAERKRDPTQSDLAAARVRKSATGKRPTATAARKAIYGDVAAGDVESISLRQRYYDQAA